MISLSLQPRKEEEGKKRSGFLLTAPSCPWSDFLAWGACIWLRATKASWLGQVVHTGGNAGDSGHFGLEEGLMSAPFLSLKAELAGLRGVKDPPPFSIMCPPHLCFQEVPVISCSVYLSSRNWPHTSELTVTQC